MEKTEEVAKPANAREFINQIFLPKLAERFREKWPDAFVICETKDPVVHDAANGNMYSYYINFANALHKMHGSPKFTYAKYDHTPLLLIEAMYEDFCKTEDWLGWIIENTHPFS